MVHRRGEAVAAAVAQLDLEAIAREVRGAELVGDDRRARARRTWLRMRCARTCDPRRDSAARPCRPRASSRPAARSAPRRTGCPARRSCSGWPASADRATQGRLRRAAGGSRGSIFATEPVVRKVTIASRPSGEIDTPRGSTSSSVHLVSPLPVSSAASSLSATWVTSSVLPSGVSATPNGSAAVRSASTCASEPFASKTAASRSCARSATYARCRFASTTSWLASRPMVGLGDGRAILVGAHELAAVAAVNHERAAGHRRDRAALQRHRHRLAAGGFVSPRAGIRQLERQTVVEAPKSPSKRAIDFERTVTKRGTESDPGQGGDGSQGARHSMGVAKRHTRGFRLFHPSVSRRRHSPRVAPARTARTRGPPQSSFRSRRAEPMDRRRRSRD